MATVRENSNKEAPHSTNSLSSVPSSKSEKSKRNHAVLTQWLETHNENPYPTKAEKHYLACYANMTQRQLNDWFANARRNIKKIGFTAWKAKHSPTVAGSRSRRHLPAAVQPSGSGAHVFTGAIDPKATYRFPTLYPSPATATAISQNSNYLPTTTRGLIQLPIFNKTTTPTQFGSGTPCTSTTLYTLYPPHTSSQCSCSYCSVPTAFSSHGLGTMPVFSGFNSPWTSDIIKHEIGASSSFTPLTHVSEILPRTQSHSIGNGIDHHDNRNGIPSSCPQQGLKEAQTPPETEVCKCSPSSVRSVTPLEQQFSSTAPCPTLPTSSESASIAVGYESDASKSRISASVPEQELCAIDQIVYNSRPVTKPLFHLPNNNLELMTTSSSNSSSSHSNPQWMWSGINSASTQLLYEAELPVLTETPSDSIKEKGFTNPTKGGINQAPAELCVDQAH